MLGLAMKKYGTECSGISSRSTVNSSGSGLLKLTGSTFAGSDPHPARSRFEARRRQLLVREADGEAARIILAHLGVGVAERRVVPVPGDVHRPDIHARVAVVAQLGERIKWLVAA